MADLVVRGVSAEVIDEAEIVVSELVANALRHAHALPDGTVRVHWKEKNGAVEVEVSDGGGPTEPRPAPRSTWAAAGRGLRIVRSLAHEWGVQEDRGGPHRLGCPRRPVPAPQHLTGDAACPHPINRPRAAPGRRRRAGPARRARSRVTDHGQGIQAPYGES